MKFPLQAHKRNQIPSIQQQGQQICKQTPSPNNNSPKNSNLKRVATETLVNDDYRSISQYTNGRMQQKIQYLKKKYYYSSQKLIPHTEAQINKSQRTRNSSQNSSHQKNQDQFWNIYYQASSVTQNRYNGAILKQRRNISLNPNKSTSTKQLKLWMPVDNSNNPIPHKSSQFLSVYVPRNRMASNKDQNVKKVQTLPVEIISVQEFQDLHMNNTIPTIPLKEVLRLQQLNSPPTEDSTCRVKKYKDKRSSQIRIQTEIKDIKLAESNSPLGSPSQLYGNSPIKKKNFKLKLTNQSKRPFNVSRVKQEDSFYHYVKKQIN